MHFVDGSAPPLKFNNRTEDAHNNIISVTSLNREQHDQLAVAC